MLKGAIYILYLFFSSFFFSIFFIFCFVVCVFVFTHLGNYVSTNISDRNIIANVCDLYQRSNLLISDFRVCDSQTLDCLHKTYCMHMYGFELWNLNYNYVDEFRVSWRKIKRRIWRLPNRAHNEIVQNLSYNIDDQLETRMIKFIHMCLNHGNEVCKSISLSKLPCKNSAFSSNYNLSLL